MSELLDQARKAVILAHLSKLDKILQQSEVVYNNFPAAIKDHLDTISEDEEILGEYSMVRLCIAIAQMSKESRTELQKMVTELTLFLNKNEDDLDSCIVDPADEELLHLLVATVKKLRTRSKNQIKEFLNAVTMGSKAYLLLYSDRKNLDISHRYRVPTEVTKYFFDEQD